MSHQLKNINSNPSRAYGLINSSIDIQLIRPPFPPTIDPKDLIKKSRDGVYIKAPNAFIIYRKLFIESSRREGHFLPMTVISAMTSQSWEQESEMVKNEYKRIAKAAFDYRKELIPKPKQRRKREKWNIISFENTSSVKNNSSNDNKLLQNDEQNKIPSTTNELNQFIQENPFDFTQYLTPSSSEISYQNTLFEMENLLEFQNFYTSLDLSINNLNSTELLNEQPFDLISSDLTTNEYFESQIQDEIQNYQQTELELETYINNIDIDNLEISEFITTGFNNTSNLSFDISNDESHNEFNDPPSFSEMNFDYSFLM
ncbi:hypothetical protein C1645_800995 [Glomus cerebriforme]|uniref:HMG box domain-containing protein n=1 Tax=Glomus cerebriforme TaxID=658196 RepID=A0A397TLG1_9GLOM|nr:hypothetical protein C1645_800995 [Glomus cerebriforme]